MLSRTRLFVPIFATFAVACGGAEFGEMTSGIDSDGFAIKASVHQTTFEPTSIGVKAELVLPFSADEIIDVRTFRRETVPAAPGAMRTTLSDLRFFGCETKTLSNPGNSSRIIIKCRDEAVPEQYSIFPNEKIDVKVMSRSESGNLVPATPIVATLSASGRWGVRADVMLPIPADEIANFRVFKKSSMSSGATSDDIREDMLFHGCHMSIASGAGQRTSNLRVLCRHADMPNNQRLLAGDEIEVRYFSVIGKSSLVAQTYSATFMDKPWGVRAEVTIPLAAGQIQDFRAQRKEDLLAEASTGSARTNLLYFGCFIKAEPSTANTANVIVECESARFPADRVLAGGEAMELSIVRELRTANPTVRNPMDTESAFDMGTAQAHGVCLRADCN